MQPHRILGAVLLAAGLVVGLAPLALSASGTWSDPPWLVIAFAAAVLGSIGLAALAVADVESLRTRSVQPRAVWGGVAIMVLGGVLIGVALVSSRQDLAWPAVVVVAVGAVLSWLGGVMGEAGPGGHGLEREIDDVKEGEVREGTWPADQHEEADAVQESVAIERRAARRRLPTASTGARDLGQAGAATLMGLAVWIFVSPWVSGYPMEPEATDAQLMQTAVALVVGVAGLWLFFRRGAVPALGLATLGALWLVLAGLFADQPYRVVQVTQVVTGVLVLAAAGLTAAPLLRDRRDARD